MNPPRNPNLPAALLRAERITARHYDRLAKVLGFTSIWLASPGSL